jgi:hypothetical protein
MKVLGELKPIDELAGVMPIRRIHEFVNLAPTSPDRPFLSPTLDISFSRRVLSKVTKFLSLTNSN